MQESEKQNEWHSPLPWLNLAAAVLAWFVAIRVAGFLDVLLPWEKVICGCWPVVGVLLQQQKPDRSAAI